MRAHEGQGMSEDQHKTKTAENMLGRERDLILKRETERRMVFVSVGMQTEHRLSVLN